MKIENEVIGKITNSARGTEIGISLYIGSEVLDYFALDISRKYIITKLKPTTKSLLSIGDTYKDCIQLIKDLGLELSESYKRHWKPKINEKYVRISDKGDEESDLINKF